MFRVSLLFFLPISLGLSISLTAQNTRWASLDTFPWVYYPEDNEWAYVFATDGLFLSYGINSEREIVLGEIATPFEWGESPDKELLQDLAWYTAENLRKFQFDSSEIDALVSAFRGALSGTPEPGERSETIDNINTYLRARQLSVNADYFAGLDANPSISKTSSGLYYQILVEGSGAKAGSSDTVLVNYVGTFIHGDEFDRSSDPVTFSVGGLISGFSEGLQLISPGGKIILYIPPELAYGANGSSGGSIPGNTILIFEIELLEVNP